MYGAPAARAKRLAGIGVCAGLRRLERPPRRLRTTCAECTGCRRRARGKFDPGQTSHVPALTRPARPNGRTIISDLPGDLYPLAL